MLDFRSTPSPDVTIKNDSRHYKCVPGEHFPWLRISGEKCFRFQLGTLETHVLSSPVSSPSRLRELLFLPVCTLSFSDLCPGSGFSSSSSPQLCNGAGHFSGEGRGELRGVALEKLGLLPHFAKNLYYPQPLSMQGQATKKVVYIG